MVVLIPETCRGHDSVAKTECAAHALHVAQKMAAWRKPTKPSGVMKYEVIRLVSVRKSPCQPCKVNMAFDKDGESGKLGLVAFWTQLIDMFDTASNTSGEVGRAAAGGLSARSQAGLLLPK